MMERKTVIITGASRGLGKEIALRFGRAGWGVLVNYLNSREAAEAVVSEITHTGGDAQISKTDVREYPSVKAMADAATARWGRVDVLVNNAGVGTGGLLLKLKEETWDEVMDTNLKGAFNCTKAISGLMLRQRAGHIINIGSIVGIRGKTGHAAYAASKAGLIGLTKATATELAPRGIQANCVLPGYMLTDMGEGASEKAREDALADNLLKRYSDPAEIADFFYHLAGMKAVSGQVFNLDSRII